MATVVMIMQQGTTLVTPHLMAHHLQADRLLGVFQGPSFQLPILTVRL
jgi:hypothetical protein